MDTQRLDTLVAKTVNEVGAAANAALVMLGDKLGLFKALREHGPLSSAELANRTGTAERYVREWLAAQAASGFVDFDPRSHTFELSPEQAMIFADEESPVLMTGAFYSIVSIFADTPKLEEAFLSGNGIGWGEHHSCLFCGTAKFFRPSYQSHLISNWIPSLEGVHSKLERGAKVADVGCGHGLSTIFLAQAFPNSTFVGFDPHEPSLLAARSHALEHGLTNVRFERARAKDYPGKDYDLVCFFDCLHDMGDPRGAAAHVYSTLAPKGTWMVVEPNAGDSLEENLNPIGRTYYAFSASVCTPASLSEEVGMALGTQAGARRLSNVIRSGGFTSVRKAIETPFNMVLEARP